MSRHSKTVSYRVLLPTFFRLFPTISKLYSRSTIKAVSMNNWPSGTLCVSRAAPNFSIVWLHLYGKILDNGGPLWVFSHSGLGLSLSLPKSLRGHAKVIPDTPKNRSERYMNAGQRERERDRETERERERETETVNHKKNTNQLSSLGFVNVIKRFLCDYFHLDRKRWHKRLLWRQLPSCPPNGCGIPHTSRARLRCLRYK